MTKIMISIGMIIFCIMLGAVFYQLNGEFNGRFVKSMWWSLATVTTIGYGDLSLEKDSSRVFTIFFMLFSVIISAAAIANISAVRDDIVREKKATAALERLDFTMLKHMDKDGDGLVAYDEFRLSLGVNGPDDDAAMEAEARKVMGRLNPNFQRFKEPVSKLSGGQRQSVAIARAILFNARILIMDEPTAALGPQETEQVSELIQQLKKEGIGIFLISHDIHDVFDLADRVAVMKNGQMVGYARTEDVSKDEVLGMIIMGKCPAGAEPGPGAMQEA